MKSLKGSRTEQNLKNLFEAEAVCAAKLLFYTQKAREEGREELAEKFEEMFRSDLQQAKSYFALLHAGIPTTVENLLDAAADDHKEWTETLTDCRNTAAEEEYDEIAGMFSDMAGIEKDNEETCRTMLEEMTQKSVL